MDHLPIPVLTSAYPGHYPRPWLLEESLPVRHAVGTCSGRLSERTYGVTPFPVPMVRIGRAVPSTGFLGQCKPVSVEGCRRPILCRFGSSASASCAGWHSRWLNAPLLALPIDACWTGYPDRGYQAPPFIPASDR